MINVSKIGMKNNFLLIIPILFFFISFTSAAVDTNTVDDTFQVNYIVPYSKACINNGTYCSDSATCNFTFFDLDNHIIVNNELGTQVGVNGSSLWQKNITYTKTGVYQIDMVCIDLGNAGARTVYAQVTGSGLNDTTLFYVIIIVLSLGIIFLGFYMSDPPITILGTFGLYFLGLYILFNGIAGLRDLTTTWGIGIITLGVAAYISVRSAHELITDK